MDGVAKPLSRLLLLLVLSGCGWIGDGGEESFDEELPSLDAAVTSTAAPIGSSPGPAEPGTAAQNSNVSPGSRFALRRRVEQTLSQGDLSSHTTLELDFTVSIDEIVDDGSRRFGVHYERVRYSGDLAGESFEYDSQSSAAAPVQAMPFHGLVNNSFYFWIDQAGQMKLVGFDRFLRRCVEGLPHADREAVLARLSVISDAEGVARFVDETIGLLDGGQPASSPGGLKVGDHWTRLRNLSGNVPSKVFTNYIVESLDENDVKLQMHGVVSAPENEPIVIVSNSGMPSITVTGGKTSGTCTIERRTGLPRSSRIEQTIDMSVQLADGTTFEQQKQVVSTTERPAAN